MAHQVQPQHKPHDQLRTEAPIQKAHDDKYVSCFTSGSGTVDITFRNPVLQKSADYFKVGIDELTVNLGNLSMLEAGPNEVLFVIRRAGRYTEQSAFFQMHDGPVSNANQQALATAQANLATAQGAVPPVPANIAAAQAVVVTAQAAVTADLNKWRNAFQFTVDRSYNTLQEIINRFQEVANAVGAYIRENGTTAANGFQHTWAAGAANEYFNISITANGQLRFTGASVFWANFVIEVPLEKYRQILFKDPARQYVSIDPPTGALRVPYTAGVANGFSAPLAVADDAEVNALTEAQAQDNIQYVGSGNLLNTIDRRVTIEVGCSLPIQNSPLVDHGKEAPDFVLGRYMFHKPYSMSTDASGHVTVSSESLGVQTLQGPEKRVVYHHLKPQQKINTLRLKLWARVRTYNATAAKWGMQTIVCPAEGSDYWHLRLHFTPK